MYAGNEGTNYGTNNSAYNQTVPNVMSDEAQFNKEQPSTQQDPVQPIGGTNPFSPQPPPSVVDAVSAPPFDIPDAIVRRTFFRKVFTNLLLQNLSSLPIIAIFLYFTKEPVSVLTIFGMTLINLGVFVFLYMFNNWRRYSPMNYYALIGTTLLSSIAEACAATWQPFSLAFLTQLIYIAMLFAIILFSMQDRFKFNNINGILVAFMTYVVCYGIAIILAPLALVFLSMRPLHHVVYCIYDAQLQLTGFHGYNLQPDEHVFATTNIYANLVNFYWRLFRFFVVNQFIRMYEFLKSCCFAEVC